MELEKVHVRNERLWKAGLLYLLLSLVMTFATAGLGLTFSLVNVTIALVLLISASRLRALRISCEGNSFLLDPDYSTSRLILKTIDGRVLLSGFFQPFGEVEFETPCGLLRVRTVSQRFGKVELQIKAGGRELTLP